VWFTWRRRRLSAQLSAYLDGELDRPAQDEVTDHIVLDPDSRSTLAAYAAVDRLVERALAPPCQPNPATAADRLTGRCRMPGSQPATARPSMRRRHLAPAVVASVGILLTAGVTLVGLRRRGIV